MYCPRDPNTTWCKYWKAEENRANYKPSINIPPAVAEVVNPIFSHANLGEDKLLKRCLHGQTQNVNEALNQLIWKRCHKTSVAGKEVVDIATAGAVLQYNDGGHGIIKVMKRLNMKAGYFASRGIVRLMRRRIYHSDKKTKETAKKRRKKLRSIKKGFQDKDLETEGEKYCTGKF
jgi:hypothetical protein